MVKGSPAAKARMKKVRAGIKLSKSSSKSYSKAKPKAKAKAKAKYQIPKKEAELYAKLKMDREKRINEKMKHYNSRDKKKVSYDENDEHKSSTIHSKNESFKNFLKEIKDYEGRK